MSLISYNNSFVRVLAFTIFGFSSFLSSNAYGSNFQKDKKKQEKFSLSSSLQMRSSNSKGLSSGVSLSNSSLNLSSKHTATDSKKALILKDSKNSLKSKQKLNEKSTNFPSSPSITLPTKTSKFQDLSKESILENDTRKRKNSPFDQGTNSINNHTKRSRGFHSEVDKLEATNNTVNSKGLFLEKASNLSSDFSITPNQDYRRSSLSSLPYSITTISTASSGYNSDSHEWFGPEPTEIQKNTNTRKAEHSKVFKEITGFRSARDCAENEGEIYSKPQIGHVHGFQNHGSEADTRKDNLAIIEQAGNLRMNVADGLYPGDKIDGNIFRVKKGTLFASHSNQHLLNPHRSDLLLTPSMIIDTRRSAFDEGDKKKYAKQATRAFDPQRIAEIQSLQDHKPEVFKTRDKTLKRVEDRIRKDKMRGTDTGLKSYKFSDQSRSSRHNNPYESVALQELEKISKRSQSYRNKILIDDAISHKKFTAMDPKDNFEKW